jgi:hypothetical protein
MAMLHNAPKKKSKLSKAHGLVLKMYNPEVNITHMKRDNSLRPLTKLVAVTHENLLHIV